jgi:5-methylcytosine-specific restriction endonuclease McrA
MEKQCPVCNKIFTSFYSTKVYCSETCRRKNWKNRHKEEVQKYVNTRARKATARRRESLKVLLTCPNCGKEFFNTDSPNLHQIRFCSPRCRGLYNNKLSKKREREKEPMRKCLACGQMFDPREFYYYKTVQTCSKKCTKKLWRMKHKNDPEYKKYKSLRQRNRKHRIRANGGNLTNKEWEDIKKKFDYKCAICGGEEPFKQSCTTLTQDHIKPISKGGRHIKENIQPLCMECNIRKHNK